MRTRRPVILIEVDGQLAAAPWTDVPWHLLTGVFRQPETSDAISSALPSAGVLDHIRQSLTFTRQDVRLRRAAGGVALLLVVMLAIAALAGKRANDAAGSLLDAERHKALADVNAAKAEKSALEAESRAQIATTTASQAFEQAEHARQLEAVARAGADTAIARRLSAQSLLIRTQSPNRIRTSLLVGLESLRRRLSLATYESVIGDLSLSRLGRRLSDTTASALAFTRDGRSIVALSGDALVRLDVSTHQVLERQPWQVCLSQL
jgi:hypothetical protein